MSRSLTSVLTRVGTIESTLSDMSQTNIALQALTEANTALAANLQSVTDQLNKSMRKNTMLAKQVEHFAAAMAGGSPSPRSRNKTAPVTNQTVFAGTKRSLDEISAEAEAEDNDEADATNDEAAETIEGVSDDMVVEAGDTEQESAAATRTNAFQLLTGLAETKVDLKDITVMSEMERFWAAGTFQNKKAMAAENNETVPRRALFDTNNSYFFGYNPDCFNDDSGMKKRSLDAMTMVAIAFTSQQWNRLFDDNCELDEMRSIVGEVLKQMHANLKAWEIRFCNRSETSRFNILKNLRAIANKWNTILGGLKKTMNFNNLTDPVFKEWLADKLGEPPGSVGQSSLDRFLR